MLSAHASALQECLIAWSFDCTSVLVAKPLDPSVERSASYKGGDLFANQIPNVVALSSNSVTASDWQCA